jgi:PAS domain S-box-containing protein
MQVSHNSINTTDKESTLAQRIRHFSWILISCWTVLITLSWYWNFQAERKVFHKVALAEANAVIERDALYRRWGAAHGGVYVPATRKTPPTPYLSHIPERDIQTPSGKQLTLINPAYMTRQVNELAGESSAFLGRAHLTSLKPIRPENAPDAWEAGALRSFEKNTDAVSAVTVMDGKPYMRLMKPFMTEAPCLKCHAAQGHVVGSIRGGISVSIPIQPLLDASRGQMAGSLAFHGLIWLLGMGATIAGARQLSRSALAQKQIENDLHQQAVILEEEIAERQMAQESLQESESHLKIVADYSSNWEYWRQPDDKFMYMSPSVMAITGYNVEEFDTDPGLLHKIIHPDDHELFLHHIHDHDCHGLTMPIEIRIVCKDGVIRWISHVCQQVFTPNGIPWGWRASNQDITERKEMEHELFEQTEELEEEIAEREEVQAKLEDMNQSLEERIKLAVSDLRNKDQALIQQSRLAAMGEMINNIAHQWRQPLNNIGLIIQNLQFSYETGTITRQEMQEEIGKTMDIIIHMSRTIDDFRNFFRKDKDRSTFPVSKTVHRAIEFVSSAMSNRNIKVKFEDNDNVTASGYQNEYAQVLLNILSNASEACVERCIEAPCITIRISSENGRSVVCISDNCGGIADEIMPKIFDPYFTTRSPDKGTGIGLYMSKVIIEQNMNGRLTASNTGSGVEFRIEV